MYREWANDGVEPCKDFVIVIDCSAKYDEMPITNRASQTANPLNAEWREVWNQNNRRLQPHHPRHCTKRLTLE